MTKILAAVLAALLLAGCGGGFDQADIDAAVAEALAEQATTTTASPTTKMAEEEVTAEIPPPGFSLCRTLTRVFDEDLWFELDDLRWHSDVFHIMEGDLPIDTDSDDVSAMSNAWFRYGMAIDALPEGCSVPLAGAWVGIERRANEMKEMCLEVHEHFGADPSDCQWSFPSR